MSSPETFEPEVEYQPLDSLAPVMRRLLAEEPPQIGELEPLRVALVDMFLERGAKFEWLEQFREYGLPWGKNYAEQLKWLQGHIFNVETVTNLESWGAGLLESRGRKIKRDKATERKGVVMGQVVLDFFRFCCDKSMGGYDKMGLMGTERLAGRLRDRMDNWKRKFSDFPLNPTPCSGEILALGLHWISAGEMASDGDKIRDLYK